MRRLWNLLRGYVEVTATGGSVGRFFNLCVNNGIELWKVQAVGEDEYRFLALKRDIWSMHPYLHKTKTRLVIEEKHGLPFFCFRYRRRLLFPIALAAVILLFGYASRFIWKIEVFGNSYLTEEALTSYLEQKNAGFGADKSKIDCDSLELALREDFEQVIWASVSIEGTDLIVELQEKVALPGEKNEVQEGAESEAGGSYDMVADTEAVIESIITRTGTPQVKAGDLVKAGDVLVEGRQKVLGDDETVKSILESRADADVIGTVTYPYEDTIPVADVEYRKNGERVCEICLELFGKSISIPLPGASGEHTETSWEYHQLKLSKNYYLPFRVGIARESELEEYHFERTGEEALALAEEHLEVFIRKLSGQGAALGAQDVAMKREGDNYRVKGTVTASRQIGVVRPDTGKEEISQ